MRVPAPRRSDEQPHALLGDRPVQEAMHGAVGDLLREQALLIGAAGDDQHQLRELRVNAVDELSDGAADCGAVDHRDPTLMGQERAREVHLGADRQHRVRRIRNPLQRGNELRIACEGDERGWHEPQPRRCDTEGRRRPRASHWDLGGHDCHKSGKPARRAAMPGRGIKMT